MNHVIEKFTYRDLLGDSQKMRFKTNIDSFDDVTEIGDTERIVRTNFNLTMKGYFI